MEKRERGRGGRGERGGRRGRGRRGGACGELLATRLTICKEPEIAIVDDCMISFVESVPQYVRYFTDIHSCTGRQEGGGV